MLTPFAGSASYPVPARPWSHTLTHGKSYQPRRPKAHSKPNLSAALFLALSLIPLHMRVLASMLT